MSWEQLKTPIIENAEIAQREMTNPPTACPHDGEPLRKKDNVWYCTWGDYYWPFKPQRRMQ